MPDNQPEQITIADMVAEIERELAYRRQVFKRLVAEGKMDPDFAARRSRVLKAAAEKLKDLPGSGFTRDLPL